MKRLALMIACGALWLILAAVPALADGGPHVLTTNNGSLGLNADGCAGCHRAHTAQGPYLLTAEDATALCKTCHGAAVTGATTDVMTGVQYALTGRAGPDGGTQLGALRNGGFVQARIDASTIKDAGGVITSGPSRLSYDRTNLAPVDISQRPRVGVGVLENVTSSHLAMTENGLTMPGVAWGNGANGSGAGPVVTLTCASCHNPHGNGQYRILNPIPETADADTTGTAFDDHWVITIVGSRDATDRILTKVSHALLPGDAVAIAGTTFDGSYVVAAIGNDTGTGNSQAPYFTVYATGASGTLLNVGESAALAGTVTRTSGAKVTDSPLGGDVDATTPGIQYATKNYTVIQTKGTQGTDSTYLLYASQVSDGPTEGDYFHRNVPWTIPEDLSDLDGGTPTGAVANDAPNGRPATLTSGTFAGQVGFSEQITAWCSACHTRYFADRNPTGTGIETGSAWGNPRPGDDLYKYQHRTVPNRACVTCHVSHGTNAAMDGDFSSAVPYPNGNVPGVTLGITNGNSRLLKIDNRGTCQACHDPTNTTVVGSYTGPLPMPSVP